ncbi:MAG: molybdate ABC transporter permease subunit [Planctomycetes bacterium]|nr:molybdate ABC transporter permease subunit [Planctomycetota bacterium]MCB9909110.1 molybdate ABC transporter permease subunit [Planctomycetota bacterium]MCB9911640.1 molybdate ABC transporter permease subunit [Planctomycetota bacterium]
MLDPSELQILQLALTISAWVVVVSWIPGVLVAWCLARWQSRWRVVLHGLVLLPLVLPPVVTGYGLLHLLGRSSWLGETWFAWTGMHLAYTTAAAVIAAAVVGFPLLVESIRLSMTAVDPRLEWIARSLGWSRWQTFLRVLLPLSAPGVLAGMSLAFARSLGEFGATIVLAGNIEGETRQIPLAVYTLMNQPGHEAAVWRLCGLSVLLALGSLAVTGWLRQRAQRRAGTS